MIYSQDRQADKTKGTIQPGLQFLIFISLFAGVYLVGNLIGAGIVIALYGSKTLMAVATLKLTTPHFVASLWILQLTSTTLTVFVAPVFFAYVIVKEPQSYLKQNFSFPWTLIVLVLAIMLISNPLTEFLASVNQRIGLPSYLKWMTERENNAQKEIAAILQMKTVWDMLLDLLLIGLLTAIAEEFMFRGVMQTIFIRWTKNTHVAIWITAILFSAFHIEFFGFLPRMMLGALFGYFVAWSGSIWTSVWAHFIYNGTAVVAVYLFEHKLIKVNPDDQHLFSYAGYLFSLLIVLFLFFVYRKIALDKKQIPEY